MKLGQSERVRRVLRPAQELDAPPVLRIKGMQGLGRQQQLIDQFKATKTAVAGAADALEKAQAEAQRLGREMAAFGPLQSLTQALQFEFTQVDRIGADLRILARPPGRADFLDN